MKFTNTFPIPEKLRSTVKTASLAASAPNWKFRNRKLGAEAHVKAAALLEMMQGPRVKLGAGVGGDQEASFEQAFASLGYTYLKDKAPRLLDYLIGFQLVDRDDDKTKAVGIFGFKVGQQWLYAPVFFLNGQMKGHELLYLKGQDQFVPMKESWVNFVLAQRPHVLGEPEHRNLQQLGVMQPNLYRLSQPPHSTKFGSVQVDLPGWKPWAMEFAPIMGELLTTPTHEKHAGLDERLNLVSFLRSDLGMCKQAMEWFHRFPALYASARKFHGDDFLKEAFLHHRQQAVEQEKQAAANPRRSILGGPLAPRPLQMKVAHVLRGPEPVKQAAGPKVEIHVDQDAAITHNVTLSDGDKQKLKRDGHLIKDHRDGEEVSKKYNTQVLMELTNPDATGIYEMLVKPQGFAKCLVIAQPYSNEGQKDFSTIIRLDPKDWINAHRSSVFAKPKIENEEDTWSKWFAKQGKASLTKGGVFVIVSQSGSGTTPFRVEEDLGGDKYRVRFKDYSSKDRPRWMPSLADKERDWDNDYYYGQEIISLSDREGTKFKAVGKILYVPNDVKIIRVEKTEGDTQKKNKDNECVPCCGSEMDSSSKDPPLEPGNLADIQTEMMRKQSSVLKLYSNGNEISINRGPLQTKRAALFALTVNHGFRESDAREFIKDAEKARMRQSAATIRVKYADQYPYPTPTSQTSGPGLGPGPGAPAFNQPPMGADSAYGDVMTQYPQEETQPVPEMSAQNTDPNTYNPLPQYMPPDPMAQQSAQQAGQKGQKEVFDTAMISGLIRTSRQDNLINRYLGDLLRALDRLGRLLFVFYWHNDEFRDKYGSAELPELEDALRNTFESVGDVVLFLKEKDVAPIPGMQFSSPDLLQSAEAM